MQGISKDDKDISLTKEIPKNRNISLTKEIFKLIVALEIVYSFILKQILKIKPNLDWNYVNKNLGDSWSRMTSNGHFFVVNVSEDGVVTLSVNKELYKKFIDEANTKFKVKLSKQLRLSKVDNVQFKLVGNEVQVFSGRKFIHKIKNYPKTIADLRKHKKGDRTLSNNEISKIIVLTNHMRGESGINWSPYSSYIYVPEDSFTAEFYSNPFNNQLVNPNNKLNPSGVCILYSEIYNDLMGTGYYKQFPEGAKDILDEHKDKKIHGLWNPPYVESLILEHIELLMEMMKDYPNLVMAHFTLPYWPDMIEKIEHHFTFHEVVEGDRVFNGEFTLDKKINFRFVRGYIKNSR